MIGEMKNFLGLQITQSKDGIFISQTKYLKELLKNFGMEDCKLVGKPMVISCKLTTIDDSPKKFSQSIGQWLEDFST